MKREQHLKLARKKRGMSVTERLALRQKNLVALDALLTAISKKLKEKGR